MLASEVLTDGTIPGIDAPLQDRHKVARLLASAEKAARDARQQNAEFDEEANRLFGDTSSEDEKDDQASGMEVETQVKHLNHQPTYHQPTYLYLRFS
jgi:hypothetical protein